jgi:beta-N-acetylhexosaminidase
LLRLLLLAVVFLVLSVAGFVTGGWDRHEGPRSPGAPPPAARSVGTTKTVDRPEESAPGNEPRAAPPTSRRSGATATLRETPGAALRPGTEGDVPAGAALDTAAASAGPDALLASLSLREKAAQVMLVDVPGKVLGQGLADFISEARPGGVLLFERNIGTVEETRALTAALQQAADGTGAIPLLVAVDQEGGPVRRLKEGVPLMPAARAIGREKSVEQTEQLAYSLGLALRSRGINMNLAPVLDVVDDPSAFMYRRSYGPDARTVWEFGTAAIRGYAASGVMSSAKHFPGHGSGPGDTHGSPVRSTLSREALAPHVEPFAAAVRLGVPSVMVSHLMVDAFDPSRPASLSPAVVEGLLRGELGYRGVVISDSLGMLAVSHGKPVPVSAVEALAAGVDLLIVTGGGAVQREARDAIVSAVQGGELSAQRLDEAVLRILVLKQTFGLD